MTWIKELEVTLGVILEVKFLECGHSQSWKWLVVRGKADGVSAL